MVNISAVIITLNEEDKIGRCIDSLTSVADEIIVVDSFSTDNTKKICEAKGVRFIEHSFEGYVKQKNLAADAANHDFILSIDADEELSEPLIKEILKVKNNFLADGYEFNRLNNYCGTWIHHSGWYPDRKLRLYNRTKGKWGGTTIHEKIEMQPGATVEHLNGDLLHYSYLTISEHVAQANKFSGLGAESALSKGRKATVLAAVINPFWRFVRNYFFKLGFLDGYYGFVVCIINSHENFLKYIKMLELQKKEKSMS
ncbi:MAG: glycosyltransferase family 2 protein [Salinivirgaceae bacterium]